MPKYLNFFFYGNIKKKKKKNYANQKFRFRDYHQFVVYSADCNQEQKQDIHSGSVMHPYIQGDSFKRIGVENDRANWYYINHVDTVI